MWASQDIGDGLGFDILSFDEADDILGATVVPFGEVITQRPSPEFPPLIKVRENFNDKLLASVDEL